MAKQTAADEFIDIRARVGVKRLYGVVGDGLNPVVDAVRRNAALDRAHKGHAKTAAFAAGAEVRISGKLTACAGSCGPGDFHLVNGRYDVHRFMAPVLALASHIPSSETGLGSFQVTPLDRLFSRFPHYRELISVPQQIPQQIPWLLQTAIRLRSAVAVPASSYSPATSPTGRAPTGPPQWFPCPLSSPQRFPCPPGPSSERPMSRPCDSPGKGKSVPSRISRALPCLTRSPTTKPPSHPAPGCATSGPPAACLPGRRPVVSSSKDALRRKRPALVGTGTGPNALSVPLRISAEMVNVARP